MVAESNPFVGPRPFEREEGFLFFGREREASDLLSLVVAHSEVLLYAQSGAGKTSLLNAKLIPLLEKEGFEVFAPARVRGLAGGSSGLSVANIYAQNTLLAWSAETDSPERLARLSLAEFLAERPHRLDENELPQPRALIFDQFEELFTYYPERWQARRPFFEQVSAALAADPLLRVVFVIREDYLAEFDSYSGLLPGRVRARLRLEGLREKPALTALTGPLQSTGRTFAPGVAEQLVEELRSVPVRTPEGAFSTVPGEFVEPAHLQAVCQRLWQEMPADSALITGEHVRSFGDVKQVLIEFFEKSLSRARKASGLTEGKIRRWFSRALITEEGTRGTVIRGRERTGGIPNSVVATLEDEHLLRGEWRGNAHWYELSHDRFIEAIKTSNESWRARRLRRASMLLIAWSVVVATAVFASLWLLDQAVDQAAEAPAAWPTKNEVVLRLAGSNTIGQSLAPTLAEGLLRELGAERTRSTTLATASEFEVAGLFPGQTTPMAIKISAYGTKTGFEDLETGKADIAMASRRISPEEKASLAELGDLTTPASEYVLALDGLAVIVRADNPIEALEIGELREVFAGKITDWREVSSKGHGPIHLYVPYEQSGRYDFLKSLVMGGDAISSSAKHFESSNELSQQVSEDIQGIGIVGLPFVGLCRTLKLSDGRSIPLRPNALTIKTEDYLLVRRLFLYSPPSSPNPWVTKFLQFGLSEKGQKIVDSVGFVSQSLPEGAPLSSKNESFTIGELPSGYMALVQGAERVPFNIRFREASTEIDEKGLRDIGRLVAFLSDQSPGGEVLLLGFSDSTGGPNLNLELSRRRAERVADELMSEGIRPKVVTGFGGYLPVASNDTQEGRTKNRRVEIWIRAPRSRPSTPRGTSSTTAPSTSASTRRASSRLPRRPSCAFPPAVPSRRLTFPLLAFRLK